MSNNAFNPKKNNAGIATTLDCSYCPRPLGASPSDDFCSPQCQANWYRNQAIPVEPVPYAFRYGITASGEPIRTVGGPVPTQSQVDRMSHQVRRLMPTTDETLRALARVAAGLRRLA